MTVSGPTSCGKTYFLKQLLQNLDIVSPKPRRIIWLYRRWQPLYEEKKNTVLPVQFIQGIPLDLENDSFLDPTERNLIILDDLMSTAAKDPRITDLFTEGSHHRNLSVALKWLRYVSKSKGIHIQHAHNGGEKNIGDYRVNDYHKNEDGREIVFEYHGCFLHGCSKCYSKQTVNTVNKMTMADLHQRTLEKKSYLENQGYKYISKWECEFDKEIIENIDIKTFVDSVNYVIPLEPRNAFSGGRTEDFKLYHEAKDGEQIKYYDVTSLYPFINKTGKVVLEHPTIITDNFDEISKYEGLIKCRVQPPRGLHIPVLPAKINNKLMFSLCRTCTELQQTTTCLHTKTETAITGIWVTDELKMAVNKGYIVVNIYEVWHFGAVEQYTILKTGGIFTEYINNFLKMKQEASGWPSWCITEKHRQKYIHGYFEKEGILLDHNKIEKNPGLRSLAKLMLNSFLGKFGQRQNIPQVEYVSDPSVYFDMLTSDQQE
ncbi:unnamed protein product [Mytilus coruscus]|uniref:DNA-directed DNA polymerase n=1 Tax=Mytilus coruscus TaxID=42192 RepID=A0A6J8BMV6_MYTCO|nr:unnamed protein product [Mytilus coruscus]